MIVASAVIFALIVLFSAMVSRGISALAGACFACPRRTWRDRILLFQRGQFGGSFGAFFRRFGCSQPRGEEKTTTEGVGSEQRCERSPDAIVPESAVVSADPVPDDRILENAPAGTSFGTGAIHAK